MINTPNLNYARKEIQRLKADGKIVMVQAQEDDFNRKMFESSDVDVVVGLEMHDRNDYLKQRDSGLNEILCRLAKKNGIEIGIELKKIVKLSPKDKAIVLSRIMQNIRLCRRVGVRVVIMDSESFGKQELSGFLISLGASTKQVKESF